MSTSKADAEKELDKLEVELDNINQLGRPVFIDNIEMKAFYKDEHGIRHWIERTY